MRSLHAIALLSATGCIAPPNASPDVEPIEKPCISCMPQNSPLVGGHSVSWLRLDHMANDDGVRFVEFYKNGVPRSLDIDGNILRYLGGDGKWHGYKDLVGTVIRIQIENVQYDVTIAEVKNCTSVFPSPGGTTYCSEPGIPYWTDSYSGQAETYRLTWNNATEPDSIRKEVCPYLEPEPTTGGHTYEAVVFEGDHFDPVTRNITETDTTQFVAPFNIACMGSLPAKQELSRRTAATRNATYDSTISDDRQALARAWAAQYCGTEAFTKTGHQLRIRDRREWLNQAAWGWTNWAPFLNPKFKYEAVWDEHGAVCLDTPRLAVPDPKVKIDPLISAKIHEECGDIPPCTGQPWFPAKWKDHGQFLTATIASN